MMPKDKEIATFHIGNDILSIDQKAGDYLVGLYNTETKAYNYTKHQDYDEAIKHFAKIQYKLLKGAQK